MSLFKKVLSSVGIGSAKVDTVLYEDRFVPGEVMEGVVKIKGGSLEQDIEEIYFTIQTSYQVEKDDTKVTKTAVLESFKLGESLRIRAGEEVEIPISLILPFDTPLTVGRTKVWVATGLDIKGAVDPSDKDYVDVVAGEVMGALFDSLEELGFELYDAECEAVNRFRARLPFVQEFELKPRSGPFRGRFDELEIICNPYEDGADFYIELDRRARGISGFFAEMLDADEVGLNLKVSRYELDELTDRLYDLLNSYSY